MKIKHLILFIEVAKCQSFNQAAAKLQMKQPTISRQIQSLEQDLGVLLFVRDQQTLKLTDEGVIFLEEAQSILFNVQKLKNFFKE